MVQDDTLGFAIRAWLHEKKGRTGSVRTEREYAAGLASYRTFLQAAGCDLDASIDVLAPALQAWAAQGARNKTVSPATFNRQVALVSSFYEYCLRQNLLALPTNPAQRVRRRAVTAYQKAVPKRFISISSALERIETHTTQGKRDYCLLVISTLTGRRLSELAALNWEDMAFDEEGVTITWQRTKGGKVLRDSMGHVVAQTLQDYHSALASSASRALELRRDTTPTMTPVWISFARNGTGNYRLSAKALERICLKHIGTARFHTLRHSFAHEMEEQGAAASEIQRRLGHSSLATTGRYLDAMRSDENRYAPGMAAKLGLM